MKFIDGRESHGCKRKRLFTDVVNLLPSPIPNVMFSQVSVCPQEGGTPVSGPIFLLGIPQSLGEGPFCVRGVYPSLWSQVPSGGLPWTAPRGTSRQGRGTPRQDRDTPRTGYAVRLLRSPKRTFLLEV